MLFSMLDVQCEFDTWINSIPQQNTHIKVSSGKCFVKMKTVKNHHGVHLDTMWKFSGMAVQPTFTRWAILFNVVHQTSLPWDTKQDHPEQDPGSRPCFGSWGKAVWDLRSLGRSCVENGRQCRLCIRLKWDHYKQGGQKKDGGLISNNRLWQRFSRKSDTLPTFLSSQEFWWKRE